MNLQDSLLYLVNGVSVVLVQFVVRILNWPATIVVYAAQYHNWDIVAAVKSLYTLCIVCTVTWQVLEIYWFWLIIQLSAGFAREKKKVT